MFILSSILERAYLSFPKLPAVIDGDSHITYRELYERVVRLVSAMQKLHLNPGDRVAVVSKNSARMLEVQFACALGGFIFVPLNFRLTHVEITQLLQNSGAKLSFFDPDHIDRINRYSETVAKQNRVFVLSDSSLPGIDSSEHLISQASASYIKCDSKPDDIAAIYYTSGSSGEPKGVCISNLNAYCGALDGILALSLRKDDVWMHSSPLFHMASAMFVWALPLVGGAQVACHFKPADTLKMMEAEHVTGTAAPMTLISMLAEQVTLTGTSLPALRNLIYGGAPSPLAVVEKNQGVFGNVLCHVYAMTECTGFVTFLPPESHMFGSEAERERSRSAGQAVKFVEVIVVDEKGNKVVSGTMGEIVIAGPKVTKGYWNNSEQTHRALRDGWLYSGDLGYFDENGYLYVVDRKADVIKSGGESVYAVEVESVIIDLPYVREVAVIGLPDEKWGEAVTAIVVPEAGAQISIERVIAACRENLAGYKVPKNVWLHNDPLPKSAAGKVAKAELKKIYCIN